MLSLRRDDVTTTRTAVRITYFNPRLHEGGDGTKRRQLVAICKISIHASAKEATVKDRDSIPETLFQSTPPRRRRPIVTPGSRKYTFISIHASAKEATMGTVNKEKFTKISIHASAKEATLRDLCTNSHIIISIHASAKEATSKQMLIKS